MPQKVSFLLGSGISIPAGMPWVKQITEKVLFGSRRHAHNAGGSYDFGQPPYAHAGFPDEYIPRVVTFLKRLSVEIRTVLHFFFFLNHPERVVNYEDLFYVAAQIHDSEVRRI